MKGHIVFQGIAVIIGGFIVLALYRKHLKTQRLRFVRDYKFPSTLRAVLQREHPNWSEAVCNAAWEGLREYFLIHILFPKRRFGMPSHIADEAWHAMMLCTQAYENFCRKAFGSTLHHNPDPTAKPKVLARKTVFKTEVVNTWWASKQLYSVHRQWLPHTPAALAVPLLFTLDATYQDAAGQHGWIYSAPNYALLDAQLAQRIQSGQTDSGSSCGGGGSSCTSSTASGSCGCSSGSSGGCGDGSSCGSSCGGSCGGGGD